MGTHPIFESDFDCLTEYEFGRLAAKINSVGIEINVGQLEKITGEERLKQFYTQIVERLIDALCEFHPNLENVPSIQGDINDQSIESFAFDLSASLRHRLNYSFRQKINIRRIWIFGRMA